jgi:hypothetical protein
MRADDGAGPILLPLSRRASQGAFRSWVTRRLARARTPVGALLLYVVLAISMLAPLASDILPETPAQDLANHVTGIVEARHALCEGQWPLRVAPHQHTSERYPYFQCYNNLPWTLGGLMYAATDWNPYHIWKLLIGMALVLGAFYTYRCAHRLTRQRLPAVAAGALFMTAPYVLTNLHGRVAFPELVALNLLPVVFFYARECFRTPRLLNCLFGALAWAALALTHNVMLFYTAFFFALYFLTHAQRSRRFVLGLLRVGLAHGLGLCLAAWYLAPQIMLHKDLAISELFAAVYESTWLTPLGVLLAPAMVNPTPIPNPPLCTCRIGLQVGWPLLATVGPAICYLFARDRIPGRSRGALTRLLVFFGLALFMAWSPFDFWRYLPRTFGCVLFTYRLLTFVVLWGALTAAIVLAAAFPPRMRVEHLFACLLLAGFSSASYLTSHRWTDSASVGHEVDHPDMGRGGGNLVFRMTPASLARSSVVPEHSVNLAEPDYGLVRADAFIRWPAEFEVPAPWRGDTLLVEGIIPAQYGGPICVTISLDGTMLYQGELPIGAFHLTLSVNHECPSDRARFILQTPRYLELPASGNGEQRTEKVACALTALVVQPSEKHARACPLMPATQTAAGTHFGEPTRCHLRTERDGVVQLPVLFYASMLEVRHNGRDIA